MGSGVWVVGSVVGGVVGSSREGTQIHLCRGKGLVDEGGVGSGLWVVGKRLLPTTNYPFHYLPPRNHLTTTHYPQPTAQGPLPAAAAQERIPPHRWAPPSAAR